MGQSKGNCAQALQNYCEVVQLEIDPIVEVMYYITLALSNKEQRTCESFVVVSTRMICLQESS